MVSTQGVVDDKVINFFYGFAIFILLLHVVSFGGYILNDLLKNKLTVYIRDFRSFFSERA